MKAVSSVMEAKRRCQELLHASPNFYPLQSVLEQLTYIEAALADKQASRSRLDDINVGLFAAREFEVRYPDFAKLLYGVEDVVTLMRKQIE